MNNEIYVKNIKEEVQDIDGKGVVTMYVSAFNNKDWDGDIIQKGAFTKTIKENINRIKHLKDHSFVQLLGLPLEMQETEYGLLVRSAMNMKKDMVRDVYLDYKFFAENGRTLEHSIGYELPKGKRYYDKELDANIITEVKLYEYSTLSFLAANENTPMLDLKLYEKMLTYNYSNQRKQHIENTLKSLADSSLNDKEPDENLINYLHKKIL